MCSSLAALSFVGATLFADLRLGRVTELTRSVSENAMPILAELGTMRYELANIGRALDEAAEGEGGDLADVEEHLRGLHVARMAYETLPQFPGEQAVLAGARPVLDEAEGAAVQVLSDVRAGALPAAQAHLTRNFAPAATVAESALLELRRIDLDQGTVYATRAAHAMARTRFVSVVLGLICAVSTGALALLAFRFSWRAVAVQARRADELDAFAARVAHDLRGPLSAPLVVLQRLGRDLSPLSPERSMVDRSVRSLQRADMLIRDLLMFARAAGAPGSDARASLTEVVPGAVQDVEREAAEAHVHVDVADLPGREVCCAPGVLSSVVANLLNNAIKHMPSEAEERLVCIRAAEAGNCVRVEVSDTGAGVPDDAKERIFEPFVRADSSRPGLGLGLATVKRLVQSHGGRVGVHSQVGKGSVFWFELPARTA